MSKYFRPDDKEIKKKLSKLQYNVTQKNGTERAFANPYWNNKEEGIYVDIVTGEPLFLSKDKYDSGSGWPSFTRPINEDSLLEVEDNSLGMRRIEVKTKIGQTHLGHLFYDGPTHLGGKRYCMNSASLEFIPKNKLEEKGYKELLQEL